MPEMPNDNEIVEDNSTTAENILAWKELLSSKEARDFVDSVLSKSTILLGQTPGARALQTILSIFFMIVAFGCVGALAYLKLVPEGTTGVLAGIIIGFFFKRNG